MVTQIQVTGDGDNDTVYLLDDTGQVFQGWKERRDDKPEWHWVWKPVELPDALRRA